MNTEVNKKKIKPSFENLVSLVENLHNPQREEIRDVVAKIIETTLMYSNVKKEAAAFTNKKRIEAWKQVCCQNSQN